MPRCFRALFERGDRQRRLIAAQALPVLAKLAAMLLAPLEYEGQAIGWEAAMNAVAIDLDRDRVAAAARVKVQGRFSFAAAPTQRVAALLASSIYPPTAAIRISRSVSISHRSVVRAVRDTRLTIWVNSLGHAGPSLRS